MVNPVAPNHLARYRLTNELAGESSGDSTTLPVEQPIVFEGQMTDGDTNVHAASNTQAAIAPTDATNGQQTIAGGFRISNEVHTSPPVGSPLFTNTATSGYGFFIEVVSAGANLNVDIPVSGDIHVDTGDVVDGPYEATLTVFETGPSGTTAVPGGFSVEFTSTDGQTPIQESIALEPGTYAVAVTGEASVIGTAAPSGGGNGLAATIIYYNTWKVDCEEPAVSCAQVDTNHAVHELDWGLENALQGHRVEGVETAVAPDERLEFARQAASQRLRHWGEMDIVTASNGAPSIAGEFRTTALAQAQPQPGAPVFFNTVQGIYALFVEVTGPAAVLDLHVPVVFNEFEVGDVEARHAVGAMILRDGAFVALQSFNQNPDWSVQLPPGGYEILLFANAEVVGTTAPSTGGHGAARAQVRGDWSIDCSDDGMATATPMADVPRCSLDDPAPIADFSCRNALQILAGRN